MQMQRVSDIEAKIDRWRDRLNGTEDSVDRMLILGHMERLAKELAKELSSWGH